MLGSIRYNLAHLLDFDGRDARQTFWFYVLFLFLVQFGIGLIASIPIYVSLFGQVMQAAQDGGTAPLDPALVSEEMAGAVATQIWVSAISTVILIAMLAAAFVRRLHDAGYSGWIAVVPAIAQISAAIYSVSMIESIKEILARSLTHAETGAPMDMMAMQGEMGAGSLIGWVGLIVVVGFGVLKSADGPNKYGDGPVRF